jgi:hypothetical protein
MAASANGKVFVIGGQTDAGSSGFVDSASDSRSWLARLLRPPGI